MDQPLWQILFNIALIGLVARRAAFGIAVQGDRTQPALWGVYVALLVVCVFTGIAIQLSRRWVIAGLTVLLGAFTIATFAELVIGATAPAVWLVAQLVVALAGGAALIVLALRSPPEHPTAAR